jgi:putative ABC transport system permease protein
MKIKFIVSDLINSKKFSLLFILNFAIGLSGFLALDTFKNSLDQTLNAQSKAILGADLGVSARRDLSEKEYKSLKRILPKEASESKLIRTYSMVSSPSGKTMLVQLKAIEGNFPFHGYIELENLGIIKSAESHTINEAAKVWIYPELQPQLGVTAGKKLKIGDKEFLVEDIVKNDAAAGIGTNMAPRVYIGRNQLLKTNLIQPGSLAWYSRVFKVPNKTINDLEEMRNSIFESMDDADVRVFTHQNSSQQLGRVLGYLNDFLGLTALAALFLSAIGGSFLFRNFLRRRIKEIAILISLGLTPFRALMTNFIQVSLLGLASSLLAVLVSFLLLPPLSKITSNIAPIDIQLSFQPTTVLIAILLGTIACGLIALPLLVQLRNLKPSLLLNQGSSIQLKWDFISVFASLPAFLVFWGLSAWQANSFRTGSLFVALFLFAGLILGVISIFIFQMLFKANPFKSKTLVWALRDLARLKASTTTAFLSLGLGMLLLNLIPQIKASINAEIESPESSKVPSLFMFDIQEEQVDPLVQLLNKISIKPQQVSPMVRAKLLTVNGKAFEKKNSNEENLSREEERESRFRNRGFNLSYREELDESEEVIAGKPFSGRFTGGPEDAAELSVEHRFADRLGLEIGDELIFDIQSVPVKGKIVNLRKIKWTSFQPNFFVLFQPGVLEVAPKTYLATIPKISTDKVIETQNAVVNNFSNISIIDVSRLVKRMQGIIAQMSMALEFMAYLCLFAGFVVLYSIANYQARIRRSEIGIMKALGAKFSSIRNLFLWQYSVLSLMASLFGISLSLVFSYILSGFLFEGLWAYDVQTPIWTLIGGVLLTVIVTHFAIQQSLKTPPQKLL